MNSLWQTVQSQLEECVKRIGLIDLTLANEDGLLIASAGGGIDPELVAAVSPLHQSSNALLLTQVRNKLEKKGLGMEICNLQRGEHTLFLCATGQEKQSNRNELQNILKDVAKKVGL